MPFGLHWLERRFRRGGFRWTYPRKIILEVLNKAQRHLSVEDIYFRINKKNTSIGLATIYRTLELLLRLGMVKRYEFGDGKARYEINEGPAGKHHHHLICKICGKIIDYREILEEENEIMSRLEKRLSEKYRFRIDSHQIHFYGICAECE